MAGFSQKSTSWLTHRERLLEQLYGDDGIFTKVNIVATPARFDDDDDFVPSRPQAKKGKKRIYDSEEDEAGAAASSSGKYNTKDSTSIPHTNVSEGIVH